MLATVGFLATAMLATASADAQPLTTSQTRTLLTRAMVDWRNGAPDGKGASPTREFFWPSGRYTGEFDNYDAWGTYRVAKGQVCVEDNSRVSCRSILVDAQGQYWMRFEKDGYSQRIWVSKIPEPK